MNDNLYTQCASAAYNVAMFVLIRRPHIVICNVTKYYYFSGDCNIYVLKEFYSNLNTKLDTDSMVYQ